MGDSTEIVSQRNVRWGEALRALAGLRGKNVFLDLALDGPPTALQLSEEIKLIGYPKQERAFFQFLKTLEPLLPKSPATGPASRGEIVLRSEAGASLWVGLWYGPRPKVDVKRLQWSAVALGSVPALKPPAGSKGKAPAPKPGSMRYAAADGAFVVLRAVRNALETTRGARR